MSTTTTNKNYAMSWIILLASLTALGPLSIDMYLSALPQMADDFGVTTQQVANSLPAYFLGLAIGQLVYGPVSDRIGRKPPLYFGLALYAVASLLCVFAQNEWSLIAARVLQALGGCVLYWLNSARLAGTALCYDFL
jgi:MFS transporter, DHA1 family, multidrug resistance protein